jgi:deoxyribodipyrimidine photo-lyase
VSTALVWFRRDLRLADNAALKAAVESFDRVIALYIHAPEEDAPWQPGGATRWWLHHSLAALAADLGRLGSGLLLVTGPTQATLMSLVREYEADAVFWNRLYEPRAVERDTTIKQALKDAGVIAVSHPGNLLFEPWQPNTQAGDPYRVFTPFWRWCRGRLPDQAPLAGPEPGQGLVAPRGGTTLDALGLLPAVPWDVGFHEIWKPGETGAREQLGQFAADAVSHYDTRRDHPSVAGTSRLSPHLHFGEIGPRQVLWSLRALLGGSPETGSALEAPQRDVERFLSEIGWREFAHHLLFHYPDTPEQPLNPRFAHFPWRQDYEQDLEAWQRGRTGIPIVDAGMRELWATGWMHNRVRMVVASFLTKNLRVPWGRGARWFWDTLVDADLASNTMGWQWVAGTGADAAPYYRIFNPVRQAARFDPEGIYIQRWVPELRGQPPAVCHAPWEHGSPPNGYPTPRVDLKRSRQAALEAYQGIRG